MASKQELLSSKERVLKIKRDVLRIVEDMLEEDIDKEWFLKNCVKLCQADYNDVIEERNIVSLCGYPLCRNAIKKVTKQKYRISKNKVYDITERKNFCSNECYKASNFLKSQLHTLPLYMLKTEESTLKLELISDSDNRGSAGEEVVFQNNLIEREVEVITVETISKNLSSMLQEDVKDFTEHLASLNIKENVYKEKYVFGEESQEVASKVIQESSESSDSGDSDEDDDDKNLFPEYDNFQVLSNKHMPVPSNTKKAVLIDPLKAVKVSTASVTKLPIALVNKILQDWFTENTMKYLLGEQTVYTIKADHLFKTMAHTNQSPEQLKSIKEEYVRLCIKIDKLPEEVDDNDDTPDMELPEMKNPTHSVSEEKKFLELEATVARLPKKDPVRRKKKPAAKKKSVSFAANTKPPKEEFIDDDTLREPALPLVDSISQNALRRQVLLGLLRSVYLDILSTVELHYQDIKGEIKAIVDTFSLTPSNTMHKPKLMKCIAVVLFRMLTRTKLKELKNELVFFKLCDNSLATVDITYIEVDDLSMELISPQQVLKL